MAIVIVVANQKGGVGKTTTAAALIDGLKLKGKKVLGIELDPQRNLSYVFGIEGSFELDGSILSVLQENLSLKPLVHHTDRGDILPADDSIIAWRAGRVKISPKTFKTAVDAIKDEYDYIVIDTAPDKSYVAVAALCAADKVVVVIQPDMFSVYALRDFYGFYKQTVSALDLNLTVDGILITRYNQRTRISGKVKEIYDKAALAFETRVYSKPIRESVVVKIALAEQLNLFEYGTKSAVAADYQSFINDVISEE